MNTHPCWLLLIALVAPACKPRDACAPQDKPLPIQILATAGPDLNPREDGAPWAVNLWIYELKSGADLETLDFEDVLERQEKAFGDAFVKSYERAIYPGGRGHWALELDPNTTHVLTVGLFQEALGDAWYQVFAVPQGHQRRACEAASRDRPIGDPCIYLAFDEYEISGGSFPPAGFDVRSFETACAPVARIPPKPKRKRKRIQPSLSDVPSKIPTNIPSTSPTFSQPAAPSPTPPSPTPPSPTPPSPAPPAAPTTPKGPSAPGTSNLSPRRIP